MCCCFYIYVHHHSLLHPLKVYFTGGFALDQHHITEGNGAVRFGCPIDQWADIETVDLRLGRFDFSIVNTHGDHHIGYIHNEARCTITYRYENLLLIAHLATFAVWMIGKVAELKHWHCHYQANTVKTEKVLSTFFLGLEVIKRGVENFLKSEFNEAIKRLRLQHKEACGYV